jgi:hypothetical protein
MISKSQSLNFKAIWKFLVRAIIIGLIGVLLFVCGALVFFIILSVAAYKFGGPM